MRNSKQIYYIAKFFPIVFNVMCVITTIYPPLSAWTYDHIGGCTIFIYMCYKLSYKFKLCIWHRVLCISAFIALVLEWFEVNITKIGNYVIILQTIAIIGIIISVTLFVYGAKNKKRDNKSPKKAD